MNKMAGLNVRIMAWNRFPLTNKFAVWFKP